MYPSSCNECVYGTYFINATESCVYNCPEGYVTDNSTGLCIPKCEVNCTKCGDF